MYRKLIFKSYKELKGEEFCSLLEHRHCIRKSQIQALASLLKTLKELVPKIFACYPGKLLSFQINNIEPAASVGWHNIRKVHRILLDRAIDRIVTTRY